MDPLTSFFLVGALWGITNPLLKRGSTGMEKAAPRSASMCGKLLHEIWFLLTNWKVPFFPLFLETISIGNLRAFCLFVCLSSSSVGLLSINWARCFIYLSWDQAVRTHRSITFAFKCFIGPSCFVELSLAMPLCNALGTLFTTGSSVCPLFVSVSQSVVFEIRWLVEFIRIFLIY